MIKYDENDWEKVADIDQLSEGELYFVCVDGIVEGLMEYNSGELSCCEGSTFDLNEYIPDDLHVMSLNWPLPPQQNKREKALRGEEIVDE